MLGVCFASSRKWQVPTVLSYYKNVYKAFHVSSQCPHIRIRLKYVLSVREKFTYIPDSVFVLCFLSSPSINNLHKTCTYLQRAGACFWRDVHVEKRSNIQWSESLQSQWDQVGGQGVTSILDTCHHMVHATHIFHSASNLYQLQLIADRRHKTHSTQQTIGTDIIKHIYGVSVSVVADVMIKYIHLSQKDERLWVQ